MTYRRLGRSGVEVSRLCLGTMTFGQTTEEAEAARILDSAREAGVNFIDTADIYARGESERILGRLLKQDREDWVLASKVANRMGPGPNRKGLSPKHMQRALNESLERLQTDYLDILYLHIDDGSPLEAVVETLGRFLADGRILAWGVSNFRAWTVAEMVHLSARLGIAAPVVSQPYYNAMNRMPEVEQLPACAYYGLAVVPYSPLARGILTGKYLPGAEPEAESRVGRKDTRMMQTEFREESLEIAQTIKVHAEAQGMTAGQFALLWVLNNRLVTSVLAGPRTLAQWQDYLDALEKPFTAADEALIDGLVTTGHPSTPGYNDPAYPITGRQPWSVDADSQPKGR
ncbi:MAG: aldo/keto reductase [Pseudomonadota bacterium]